jgi:hypothetical protein
MNLVTNIVMGSGRLAGEIAKVFMKRKLGKVGKTAEKGEIPTQGQKKKGTQKAPPPPPPSHPFFHLPTFQSGKENFHFNINIDNPDAIQDPSLIFPVKNVFFASPIPV